MQTVTFTEPITQTEMTLADYRRAHDADAWNFMDADDKSVFVYTFGGIVGGAIIGEQADFATLTEFAAGANDIAYQIWDSRDYW
jgi:hypothetical protein